MDYSLLGDICYQEEYKRYLEVNKMSEFAIVVTGYNRAKSLKTLLKSLTLLRMDQNIPLVISLDNGGTNEVVQICKNFQWKFGDKEIIVHDKRLGLKEHFIFAGDLTEKYDNVLFLEDDLLVVQTMSNYVIQYLQFYADDDRIAGATCYNPIFTVSSGRRFYAIEDGYDNFFLQHPYWGNIWSKKKWRLFKEYLKTYKENTDILPIAARSWKRSFKKVFMQYLVETHRTMVIPRISLVTNTGVAGDHYKFVMNNLHPAMLFANVVQQYRFSTLDQSLSVYDAFEELKVDIIKKNNPNLAKYNFSSNLNGNKKSVSTPYILSYGSSKNTVMSFSGAMKPTELGVLLNLQGDDIVLCPTEDFQPLSSYEQFAFDFSKNVMGDTLPFSVRRMFRNLKNSIRYRLK